MERRFEDTLRFAKENSSNSKGLLTPYVAALLSDTEGAIAIIETNGSPHAMMDSIESTFKEVKERVRRI